MESGKEGSSGSELKEVSGGWYLEPGVSITFSTKQPAGGYLVNEIFASKKEENHDAPTGFFAWKTAQPMVLSNKGIKATRMIKAGVEFMTLKCDLKVDKTSRKICRR
jgi:hypothetical protein